ncbi:hypothetical protein SRB5_30170 [Streptomyces sp. RB5]|uniref:Methyltransferase domain-containing protein n=2 Tax=Streptomyces smaragdinus TaxID=2585196 RepID=A0A7K0CHE1_9ACTN|nr:hypothetical protein [Streptomyces smaragdinus]
MGVVEGFYGSQSVWALHRLGVLARLEETVETSRLAGEFGLDEETLGAVLDYVRRTTGLLVREGPGHRLAPQCRPYRLVAFQLDKFLGAYGPAATRLEDVLRDPASAPALRDHDALARAFGRLRPAAPSVIARVLRAWDVTSLLDLGCGAATLLVELARADPRFRGLGADASPDMVRVAGDRIRRTGLADRLTVTCGDVREPAALPAPGKVRALHGRSLLNEFFAGDGGDAVRVLTGLGARYPGRLLFLEDYYGRLTHDRPAAESPGHTLAQDLAQVLSGQGVPPPDLPGWGRVYEAADCALVKAYEGHNDGITWFVHVVAL